MLFVFTKFIFMNRRLVSIKLSSIHGHGVFALKSFRRGEHIGNIKGSRVVYRSNIGGQSNRYPDWVGISPNTWIDPIDEFQYLNHSCNPTCGVKGNRIHKVFALRDIQVGEEITIDYSTTESDHHFTFENRESPDTPYFRSIIGPIQSLPIEVYMRYLPYIPKAFQKVYEKEVLRDTMASQKA